MVSLVHSGGDKTNDFLSSLSGENPTQSLRNQQTVPDRGQGRTPALYFFGTDFLGYWSYLVEIILSQMKAPRASDRKLQHL